MQKTDKQSFYQYTVPMHCWIKLDDFLIDLYVWQHKIANSREAASSGKPVIPTDSDMIFIDSCVRLAVTFASFFSFSAILAHK